MGWPLSQEYNEAVQNPRTAFGDPELMAGEIVPGPLGIPMPRSGNFADVYQFRANDGQMWALKCFTRPASGLRERYLKIDAHLRTARLPFTVGFQFLPEGVRIRGLWFPILKMEWVEGQTLNEFVRKNIDKPDHLKALLGLWVRLCKRLRDSRMAHADLQHGNVLLVPGTSAKKLKLRLIDYDGMFVPALAKSPSGEVGHPAYQHPLRLQKGFYTGDVDRFPHLVIGCALRTLAVAGKPLWDRFDNGDNMLFREADLADPANSQLFKALWQLDDPTITNLLSLLIVCASRPLEQTPWLDEILEGEKTVPVKEAVLNHAADVLGVPRRAVRQAMPVAQIFVVPEEANDFSDLEYQGETFIRRRKKRPLTLTQAILGFGGVAVVAAAIIVGILVMQKEKVIDLGLPIDPQPVVKAPDVKARTGLIETDWHTVEAGPAANVRTELVSGIDTAPPATNPLRTFAVGEAAGLGAWLLPDGRHALTAGKTGLALLDLHTSESTRIPLAKRELHRVAFSPDAKHFATVTTLGKEQVIHCFAFENGENLWSIPFDGPVGALAFTPDGLRMAASAERIGFKEWQVKDGKETRRHELLQASSFDFTPDGKHAVAATDSGVELWSLEDGTTKALNSGFQATQVCISHDGKHAIAAAGREIKSWVLPGGEAANDRATPTKAAISTLKCGQNGILLIGSQTGEIAFVGPDETTAVLPAGKNVGVPIVSFATTTDGRYALAASEKAGVTLARLAEPLRKDSTPPSGPSAGCLELVRSLKMTSEVTYFATDGKGDRFLTIGVENRSAGKGEPETLRSRVNVYDAKFQRLTGLPPLDGRILSAGFGGSQYLVTCESTTNGLRTWARNIKSGDLTAGPAFMMDEKAIETVVRIAAVPFTAQTWVLVTTESAGDVLFDVSEAKPVVGWPSAALDDPRTAIAGRDGQRIALVSRREPIRIWESQEQRIVRTLESSEGVRSMAFLPDPTQIVGIWAEGRIRIWDISTGKIIKDVDHDYPGPFAEIAAVTNSIVLVGPARNRFLLNMETGKALNTGNGPDPLEGRGFVMPGSDLIYLMDRDVRLSAWRVNPKSADALPAKPPKRTAWTDIALLRDAPNLPSAGLTFASNGKSVLVASQNGQITRYTSDRLLQIEETDVKPVPKKKYKEADFQLKLMRQGADTLLLLSDPFRIASRNALTLAKMENVPAAAPTGSALPVLAIHPSGKLALLSTNMIRLWELVEDKKEMKEEFVSVSLAVIPKAALGLPLTQFAWSADGTTGLARWGDKVTAVWHPKKIGSALVLERLEAPVLSSNDAIALSPDGQFGILGLFDGPIQVWDTTSGKALVNKDEYLPNREGNSVTSVAVLPNGKSFLSAGRNGKVVLWETATLKKLKEYRFPEGPWRIAVSPDGRTAIAHRPGFIARLDLPAEGKP